MLAVWQNTWVISAYPNPAIGLFVFVRAQHTSGNDTHTRRTTHTMPKLTPGIIFIFTILRNLALFIGATIACKHALSRFLNIAISNAVMFLGVVTGVPALIALHLIYTDVRDRREAARLGARMVPRVRGKWPGNLDIIVDLVTNFTKAYPGDIHLPWLKSTGSNAVDCRFLWQPEIFTIEPEHVKAILATDFNNFEKGKGFFDAMSSVLGTGVFNSDGDMWKFHRSMTRPFFSRDRIGHLDLFEKTIDQAIKVTIERNRAGYPVDFQDITGRITLDAAAEFLFGYPTSSLSAELPYPHYVPQEKTKHFSEEFATAFMEAQHLIAQRASRPFWQLWEIFEDKTAKPMQVVNAFLDPIIKEAIVKHKTAVQSGEKLSTDAVGEDDTLLDHLVRSTDDLSVLKDEVLNILIAGRDTTSAALTFAMYAFAMYPEVMKKLRAEILERVGPTERPSMVDIREMKYLRAVINETLRLWPSVPFDIRYSINATTWPSPDPTKKPLYIPARTRVPYSVLLMQRRSDLWGPDALEFDPERFIDGRVKKYLTPNPFIFLPFNAGPRICLGQQFAYNEMSYCLIRLLQNFSGVTLAPEAHPPGEGVPAAWAQGEGRTKIEQFVPKSHLTMYANAGLWVRLEEATDKSE